VAVVCKPAIVGCHLRLIIEVAIIMLVETLRLTRVKPATPKSVQLIAVLADGHAGVSAISHVAVVFKPDLERFVLNQRTEVVPALRHLVLDHATHASATTIIKIMLIILPLHLPLPPLTLHHPHNLHLILRLPVMGNPHPTPNRHLSIKHHLLNLHLIPNLLIINPHLILRLLVINLLQTPRLIVV